MKAGRNFVNCLNVWKMFEKVQKKVRRTNVCKFENVPNEVWNLERKIKRKSKIWKEKVWKLVWYLES